MVCELNGVHPGNDGYFFCVCVTRDIGGGNGLHCVVRDLQLLLEGCMISWVCIIE
jgi:hypothetical protein